MNRYFFIVVDLHHLLLTGLPAHPTRFHEEPKYVVVMSGVAFAFVVPKGSILIVLSTFVSTALHDSCWG